METAQIRQPARVNNVKYTNKAAQTEIEKPPLQYTSRTVFVFIFTQCDAVVERIGFLNNADKPNQSIR